MNVYRPNPAEVRQGRAHFATVRGLDAPKVKPKAVRAATREAIGAEVDQALDEIHARSEMAAGADRFTACLRMRDQVRSLPARSNPFTRSDEPVDEELSPAVKDALEEMGEQLAAGLAKLETKITETKTAAPVRAAARAAPPADQPVSSLYLGPHHQAIGSYRTAIDGTVWTRTA